MVLHTPIRKVPESRNAKSKSKMVFMAVVMAVLVVRIPKWQVDAIRDVSPLPDKE